MEAFYDVIFRRKSMRKFNESLILSESELQEIRQQVEDLVPLIGEVNVQFKIVDRKDTTAKFGEYCLLMYSEKKPLYLLNAGYMLEQMDLFLASRFIGACWYGLARTAEKKRSGLDFVIMMAFGKSRPQDFRSSIADFNRKSTNEIWEGDFDNDVKQTVRLAPSACNTQSWRYASRDSHIEIYRTPRIKSFIPVDLLPYFNSIDMGISLCLLEIALVKKRHSFEKTLFDSARTERELLKIAEYDIV